MRKASSLPPSQSFPSLPSPPCYQQQLYSNPIITVIATIIVIYWLYFSNILTSKNNFPISRLFSQSLGEACAHLTAGEAGIQKGPQVTGGVDYCSL